MNGLKSWTYFLAHYVDFVISAAVSMIIFLLVAAAFRLEIVSINPGPISILLLVWINTAISLSFAISTIFGNARNALIGTFLVLLMSIVISIAATAIWNNDPPAPFFIWPPFACYTAVGIINTRAVMLDAPVLTAATMKDGGKLLTAIYYLLVEWVIFLLIAIYGHVSSIKMTLTLVGHSNRIWSKPTMVLALHSALRTFPPEKGTHQTCRYRSKPYRDLGNRKSDVEYDFSFQLWR